jgi:hypothetical protein
LQRLLKLPPLRKQTQLDFKSGLLKYGQGSAAAAAALWIANLQQLSVSLPKTVSKRTNHSEFFKIEI